MRIETSPFCAPRVSATHPLPRVRRVIRGIVFSSSIHYRRARRGVAGRVITFRSLVIEALEYTLEEKQPAKPFLLRDASAGYRAAEAKGVSSRTVNKANDELREPVDFP